MSGPIKGVRKPAVKGKVTIKSTENRSKAGPSSAKRPGKGKEAVAAKNQGGLSDDDEDDEGDDDEELDGNEDEADTEDEIATAQAGRSKKTAKRKRRATSPSTFGETLEQLLGGSADEEDDDEEEREAKTARVAGTKTSGQPAILSLAPHIRRGAQSSRLNAKAARLALAARRKREDRAHVGDVIAGWGAPGELPKTEEGDEKSASQGEADEAEKLKGWLNEGGVQGYEKRLRKAAQRGVVKLFNAIRAAQNTSVEDLEEEQDDEQAKSSKKGDNALGGKTKAVHELSKNNFFDLLRAGTKSKTTTTI